MKNLGFLLLGCSALALSACGQPDNSGSAQEQRATMMAQETAANNVGMPAVPNNTEKRLLKSIYELRDQANLVTYTYITDLQGKLHRVCPTNSVGFPIPYATQYTAPKALRYAKPQYPPSSTYGSNSGTGTDWHSYEADQPEPNNLYMPSSAEGTWVVCVNPTDKMLAPTYIEDRVRTYLFPMASAD